MSDNLTVQQRAYALLWREARVSGTRFLREARNDLLRSLTEAEQRAAIEWVQKKYPLGETELGGL